MRRRFFSSDSKVEFNIDNYLTIEALEDGLTASFSRAVEYGIDGVGWAKLSARTPTPPINAGQTLSFRGELTPSNQGIGTFTINKECNLLGNCMSMLFGNNAQNNLSLEGKDYAFYQLFNKCTTIVSVSSDFLPATTLAEYCYYNMFYGCTSLQTAPELPATTLAEACYLSMFDGCTSLTTAPELPATTLEIYCYHSMFYGCRKLNYIKMLAMRISALDCSINWVYGVASSGTFVKNKDATWDVTGVSGVPSGWTVIDTTFPTNEQGYPESTEFSFPLYLNCTNFVFDYGSAISYSRPADEISMALYEYLESLNLDGFEDYTFPTDVKIFCNRIPILAVEYIGTGYERYYEGTSFTIYDDGEIYMDYYK